jgi:hypothetical protein
VGRVERRQGVVGAAVCHFHERLARGRVFDGQSSSGSGRSPLTSDQQFGRNAAKHPALV